MGGKKRRRQTQERAEASVSNERLPLKYRTRQAQELVEAPPPAKRVKQSKPMKVPVTITKAPFVNNPKGDEYTREVQLYDLLGSEDDSERLLAADAIIFGLLDGEGVSEQTLQRHLERRLFRGLASGRKGSRLGFSIVVTEILSQLLGSQNLAEKKYPNLTFRKLLDTLHEKNTPRGDLSGQEERDHYFGQLFGIQCFVRAKILFDHPEEQKLRWRAIFKALIELMSRKSWLREECGFVIVEALSQLTEKQAQWTVVQISEEPLSPEGVGIWMTAQQLFPHIVCPNKPWGHTKTPLRNLDLLAKTLKQSSRSEDGDTKVQASGNWNPQPHFAWNIVLEEVLKGVFEFGEDKQLQQSTKSKAHVSDSNRFAAFWKVVVDENLFSTAASSERKYWGFQLFQKALDEIITKAEQRRDSGTSESDDIPNLRALLSVLFSHNLLRCLINHSSQEDRFLHRAAQQTLKTIQDMTQVYPEIMVSLLPKLIDGDGIYNFDQITKSKTVATMLAQIDNIDEGSVSTLIENLTSPVKDLKRDSDESQVESRRQTYGDYLLSLIRHSSLSDQSKDRSRVRKVIFRSLAEAAYSLSPDYSAWAPQISHKSRTLFRARFSSAIAHVLSSPTPFYNVCEVLSEIVPSAVEMDDELTAVANQARYKMRALTKNDEDVSSKEKPAMQALAMLYALALIQLYNGESEAVSVFEELDICSEKLLKNKEKKAADSDATQVLVEILLSFVAKPSALLRKAAELVLSAFSARLTKESLQLMMDILESSENLKGQQELFNHEDDEAEEGEDDDTSIDLDDLELDSDVEMIELDGINGDDQDGLDEESESEEDEAVGEDDDEGDETEQEDDEETRKLDDALAKALGTHRADQDLQEDGTDSDADMTDSEMIALDSKLTEIFKQRTKKPSKKKENKEAKLTIVNFKSRVLGLLEIYVKQEPNSLLTFGLLPALLRLMRTTGAKQVADGANDVIKALPKALRDSHKKDILKRKVQHLNGNDGEEEDADQDESNVTNSRGVRSHPTTKDVDITAEMLLILQDIHVEALQDASHQFAAAASNACSLVLTNLFRADNGDEKNEIFAAVAETYRDTQVKWFVSGQKLQPKFFHDFLNWCSMQKSTS